MPTQLPRTQISHTPPVVEALNAARHQWPGESDGRLLLHLIEAGGRSLLAADEQSRRDRLALIDRVSARYDGVFTESLESIREGWPE